MRDWGFEKKEALEYSPIMLRYESLGLPFRLVNGQQNVPCADIFLDRTKQRVHRDNSIHMQQLLYDAT